MMLCVRCAPLRRGGVQTLILAVPGTRASRRWASGGTREPVLKEDVKNGVVTLTMNDPKRLNAWTMPMMLALQEAFKRNGESADVGALILTGSGSYYSAGVSLADTIKPMMPRTLKRLIAEKNRSLFDFFLDFPKPIIVAANGPAIGATVTSASLCDAIIACDQASFSTPFAQLGVTPEGCSSVHFDRLMGPEAAQRMLGPEGWKPTAAEAVQIGLVRQVVPEAELLPAAQALAEQWIKEGRKRTIPANGDVAELKAVNAKESEDLANAFLSDRFLKGQQEFLAKRGKTGPATMFRVIRMLRPGWSLLL